MQVPETRIVATNEQKGEEDVAVLLSLALHVRPGGSVMIVGSMEKVEVKNTAQGTSRTLTSASASRSLSPP